MSRSVSETLSEEPKDPNKENSSFGETWRPMPGFKSSFLPVLPPVTPVNSTVSPVISTVTPVNSTVTPVTQDSMQAIQPSDAEMPQRKPKRSRPIWCPSGSNGVRIGQRRVNQAQAPDQDSPLGVHSTFQPCDFDEWVRIGFSVMTLFDGHVRNYFHYACEFDKWWGMNVSTNDWMNWVTMPLLNSQIIECDFWINQTPAFW